jgi:hypothetical protein
MLFVRHLLQEFFLNHRLVFLVLVHPLEGRHLALEQHLVFLPLDLYLLRS